MGNESSSQNNNSNQNNAVSAPPSGAVVSNGQIHQPQQVNGQQQNTVSTLKSNVGSALKKGWIKSKEASSKAIATSKRLATRTDNLPEILLLANEELLNHIQMRKDTHMKIDKNSKYFDSFRNCVGIIYVTGWSVGLGTFGGSYRRGIMIQRFEDGTWSLPFGIQEFEGSAGLQLKATIDSMFYVIKNRNEMKAFTDHNNIKVGAGAQLALGNAGVTTQADLTLSKESVTKTEDVEEKVSKNASIGSAKGFAIGASVHGGTFQGYKKANERFYCQECKKNEILSTRMGSQHAFDLLAGHPNMPEHKQNNLQIIQQFTNTLDELINVENQQEGTMGGPNGPNGPQVPSAPIPQNY